MGSLNGRLDKLEELYHQRNAGHTSEASRAREELSRKLWSQVLDAMAHIRTVSIDREPWRYGVDNLRDKSPVSIACHVVALTHMGHDDEEEARRILTEVIEERGIDGAPLWEIVEGMTAALDQMKEDLSE